MIDPGFSEISAKALQGYLAKHREGEFLLVDVRQPAEYATQHIPGASFLPLPELEARLLGLPPDRDLIFYCRSGARSAAAASLAAEAEVTTHNIFSLAGGILAWQGQTLAGVPKVQVFDKTRNLADLLYTAMDLEKGAWRFYRHLAERFADLPAAGTLAALSKAETAHARMVYQFWRPAAGSDEPFEALYDRLPGDILEGGESLAEVLERLDARRTNDCLEVIDLALVIEYSAFDLYRTMADRADAPGARKALLAIAQAEKAHMRSLIGAIDQCRAGQ